MRIAIHNNSSDLTQQWIEFCELKSLEYKLVDAYKSTIIDDLRDCDVFLWHHHHGDYRDVNFAKQLLVSVETMGKIVFPDYLTGWHFDDKVGEKYLFEALSIPTIRAHVFYEKEKALQWAQYCEYPKVFKLRGGAGASNVILVKSLKEAKRIINRAFGHGFPTFSKKVYLKEQISKWKNGTQPFWGILKGLYRLFVLPKGVSLMPRQLGYVYFQDFIPNNYFDTRVVVIGGKYAFAERRFVRKGDFRASGSGIFDYTEINEDIIRSAFESAKKLRAQSVAFDYMIGENGEPLVVEISYAFGTHGISHAPVYWTDDMICHRNEFNSIGGLILENILGSDIIQ